MSDDSELAEKAKAFVRGANWKGKEFKEYLKKKRKSLIAKNKLFSSTILQMKNSGGIYILDDIINEIFGELNMKYYTETIPSDIAEILKDKGMPIGTKEAPFFNECPEIATYHTLDAPSYVEVFDWLMTEKNIEISFTHCNYPKDSNKTWMNYFQFHAYRNDIGIIYSECGYTWYEAANATLEKVLTLIK